MYFLAWSCGLYLKMPLGVWLVCASSDCAEEEVEHSAKFGALLLAAAAVVIDLVRIVLLAFVFSLFLA